MKRDGRLWWEVIGVLWGWTEVRRLKVSVSKVKRWENGVTDVLWFRNIQRYLTSTGENMTTAYTTHI